MSQVFLLASAVGNLAVPKASKENEQMVKKYYKVIFEPQEEGGYTVTVPSLPGCISEGDTCDQALANIKEAIALYLESLQDDDLPTS